VRVVVLTGFRNGAASDYLPVLATHPGIDVAMVILSERSLRRRSTKWKRNLRKVRRIGLLGALTGLYLRTWSEDGASEDLAAVAARHSIRFEMTPAFNSERTRELFREADADLGLALGTAILAEGLFTIPRYGMLNVHGAVLPRFRGGASVLWEIYEGSAEAGFTIHHIDRGIDTGPILYVESFPIEFGRTLKETYRRNVSEICRRAPAALAEVVARHEVYAATPQADGEGTLYTTPTVGQFLRMLRQHRRMARERARSAS
jgi:methionyl-tRNA formyltransferase